MCSTLKRMNMQHGRSMPARKCICSELPVAVQRLQKVQSAKATSLKRHFSLSPPPWGGGGGRRVSAPFKAHRSGLTQQRGARLPDGEPQHPAFATRSLYPFAGRCVLAAAADGPAEQYSARGGGQARVVSAGGREPQPAERRPAGAP